MKKLLYIIFALTLCCIFFTGCASNEDKANEAIIGEWVMDTYYEITPEGTKDTTLTKYMMEKGVMTFNADGTMQFINGYKSEWKFSEYDEENGCYIYTVGENSKIKKYINEDNPDIFIEEKEFTGTNLKKYHFGTRTMTLEGLNSISWINSVPYEGTQIWIYEKVK